MDIKLLKKYFGEKFLKKESRFKSYDFVENFLSNNFEEYQKDKNTNKITDRYLVKLGKFSKEENVILSLLISEIISCIESITSSNWEKITTRLNSYKPENS